MPHLRRALSLATALALLFLLTPSICSAGVLSDLEVLGELEAGNYGASGNVALVVNRALYVKAIGENKASPGNCFVILQMTLGNRHDEPFIVENAISIRLENGPQTIPGWEMDVVLTEELGKDLPVFWKVEIQPGDSATGYAVFEVPENAKDLWYHLQSNVGAAAGKVYSGGMRGRLGDLPGEEDIRQPSYRYKAIIGSFRFKENALRWAATARKKGFSAWVEWAFKPEGMYVVAIREANDYHEARLFVDLARKQGYEDAFVGIPPKSGGK
ncbi:MAG: DUF4352 domain-containing protein [Bacillota bacterium]